LLIMDPEPQVRPAMAFLTETCALQWSDAVQVAVSCPQVFCLSLGNLQRKVRSRTLRACISSADLCSCYRSIDFSRACVDAGALMLPSAFKLIRGLF
jgi:hypothetical protein